jgi:hypothetical protein
MGYIIRFEHWKWKIFCVQKSWCSPFKNQIRYWDLDNGNFYINLQKLLLNKKSSSRYHCMNFIGTTDNAILKSVQFKHTHSINKRADNSLKFGKMPILRKWKYMHSDKVVLSFWFFSI